MKTKVFFKISHYLFYIFNVFKFGRLSSSVHIEKALKLQGKEFMYIEDNVYVHKFSWIGCYSSVKFPEPRLQIGKGVCIGHFCHISCVNNIEIEEDVLISDNVAIIDSTHSFEDVNMPIIKQKFNSLRPVRIGSGTWIADKCSILGANIGKNCVIGANSVVTKDVPDYSVAVGNPARVIKQYNFNTQVWEKV